MKLFLIEWSGEALGMPEVGRKLHKAGHEILYWSGVQVREEAPASEFPGTIFHEHDDALRGIPASGVDLSQIPPLGEDIIRSFAETEAETLTMMNKLFEVMGVSERQHLYYKHLAYWNGVLLMLRPDAIIFPTIPHTVYDFVLYRVAKRHGVKTVMMEPTWVGDRLVMLSDYVQGSLGLLEETKNAKGAALGELHEDIQAEYRLQTAKGKDATPVFVKNIQKRYSGWRLLMRKLKVVRESISDLSILTKAAESFSRRLRENLKKEHTRVEKAPDFNVPFIYVPLHYQPERNSSPQGGVFVDQLLLIETLASALPEGWMLYVKEHPTQWLYRGSRYFSYRFRGFYEHIAKLPNVRLVPIRTNSFALIEHGKGVATITGTAGGGALLRQKAVLVFGHPWYQHAPGVYKVHDRESCRAALLQVASGTALGGQAILKYLAAFDRGSFHGYIDLDGKQVSALSPEENARIMAKEISQELLRS